MTAHHTRGREHPMLHRSKLSGILGAILSINEICLEGIIRSGTNKKAITK